MYSIESVLKKTRKRFKKHFCVVAFMIIVDELLILTKDKRPYLFLMWLFTLLFLYFVVYQLYKNFYRIGELSLIAMIIFTFWLDLLTTACLCRDIPAIIFGIVRHQAPYVFIIDPYYNEIINTVTFVIALFYCIYLKYSFQVSNTFLYTWFFIIYAVSALYNFLPVSLKQVIIQHVYGGSLEYSMQRVNYYNPAIKEAVLAFTILDTANIIEKLQGYLMQKK